MPITTYKEFIAEFKKIGEEKLLSSDEDICSMFDVVDDSLVELIIKNGYHFTFGDIICDIAFLRLLSLFEVFNSFAVETNGEKFKHTSLQANFFPEVVSLLNAHPSIKEQEVIIDKISFLNKYVIPKQKEEIYNAFINRKHPEKENDIRAYTYCYTDGLFFDITRTQKLNNTTTIRYSLTVTLPDGSELCDTLYLSAHQKYSDIYRKCSVINAKFREELIRRNII